MCAPCTLALCCHNKPNPTTLCLPSPSCPFCRSTISRLVVAMPKMNTDEDSGDKFGSPKLRKSRRSHTVSGCEGSSSFMGILGKLGRGSGKKNEPDDLIDKP
ncbi:E3 ubiquitin-protein ligase XB3-like protein [Carex littledalei]|uniref:E3 ubiquitin-protein ligase XB3-like protein n=1 Tax=Carex littledalei TaxID=544730 RepID=A0A833VR12_9POAL|nr:E3 ubiquitin-protein ligase XB3-like protein [Carex littledalei]